MTGPCSMVPFPIVRNCFIWWRIEVKNWPRKATCRFGRSVWNWLLVASNEITLNTCVLTWSSEIVQRLASSRTSVMDTCVLFDLVQEEVRSRRQELCGFYGLADLCSVIRGNPSTYRCQSVPSLRRSAETIERHTERESSPLDSTIVVYMYLVTVDNDARFTQLNFISFSSHSFFLFVFDFLKVFYLNMMPVNINPQ